MTKSNLGFFGNNPRRFIAQVAPSQNEHTKDASWNDAFGDRVKIRIPSKHPRSAEIRDENLPWAIVQKSTASGHFNRTSSGIWGGEWVIGEYLDEACQIPIITGVLGRGSVEPEIVESIGGTTDFKDVSAYSGGLKAGNHQLTGGSPSAKAKGKSDPRTLPVDGKVKEEAKAESQLSGTTPTGIPSEPKITTNPDGSVSVTTYKYDPGEEGGVSAFTRKSAPGGSGAENIIQIARREQSQNFKNEVSRSNPALTGFNSSKLSSSTSIAQYTAKDKAEDKLLLRSIQRGELGPIPREQIDSIINRINGVPVRGV